MHLIKLDATPSTNDFLKEKSKTTTLPDFTIVSCDHQSAGKGQKGNEWVVEKGKNLTFSVLKRFNQLKAEQVFFVNCAVSLAIWQVLSELAVPDLKVKWPNDIMSGNHKLCGILIENSLKGDEIKQCIIGIGLNVNQDHFSNLPRASSLKLKTGKTYDLDLLLGELAIRLKEKIKLIDNSDFDRLKTAYENQLYRFGKNARFIKKDGEAIDGSICGITNSGQLQVKTENGEISVFGFKEIRYVY